MKRDGVSDGEDGKEPSTLGLFAGCLVGFLLFVPLWAGMNFVLGTALDGPVGVFVMETPCQRLSGTTEPLSRYTLGKGKSRLSSSVCHFASGPIRVADRRTDGLGFTGREFVYLILGFAGYALCFAGAMVLAVSIVRVGQRLLGLERRRHRPRM